MELYGIALTNLQSVMVTHLKDPEFQGRVHNPSIHIHY